MWTVASGTRGDVRLAPTRTSYTPGVNRRKLNLPTLSEIVDWVSTVRGSKSSTITPGKILPIVSTVTPVKAPVEAVWACRPSCVRIRISVIQRNVSQARVRDRLFRGKTNTVQDPLQ